MKSWFAPNIAGTGRAVRGGIALALLVTAGFAAAYHASVASVVLGIAGLFVLFEALRGWCAFRACEIRTKL